MTGDTFLAFSLRYQQLDTDPDQQHGTDNFQPRQGQQGHCKNRQHNTQHDGSAAAPENRQLLLLRWQGARCQRDHHCIVTG